MRPETARRQLCTAHVGKNLCGETTGSREERAERRAAGGVAPTCLANLTGAHSPLMRARGCHLINSNMPSVSPPLDPCPCCFHRLELTPGPKQALPYLLGWPLLNLLIPALNAASLERSLTALAKVTPKTMTPHHAISFRARVTNCSSHFYLLFTGSFSVSPSRIENSLRTDFISCSPQYPYFLPEIIINKYLLDK